MVFIKDIIENMAEPTPPYNTVSSLVRILETKGMVGHEAFGRTYRYFPLVSKSAYRKSILGTLITDYFDGSYGRLLSHIMTDEKLNEEETEQLKAYIKEKQDV